MSEIISLNLKDYKKPRPEEIKAAEEEVAAGSEMANEAAGDKVDRMTDAEVSGEIKQKSFWAKRLKGLKERIGVGLMVGMTLLGPSPLEARSGSQLKESTETTTTTAEKKGFDLHWQRAIVRGEDGKVHFNPWPFVFLSPIQAEKFSETTEQKKTAFELPYEYSRLFDTGKPLNPADQDKITQWIEQKLKQEFGEKVAMFGLWDADKVSLGSRDVYRTEHPESGKSEHARITSISIMGYASPEGPQAKGPDSLKPGSVDAENLNLALKRAKAAMGLTEEGLKKLGISQEQWDEASKVIGGREIQASDAEMAELADLAKGEAGADPLEQIFHLTIKYNDYVQAKFNAVAEGKDPATIQDSYLDPMMGKLDEIIGSKRKVKITITYEENKKETTLIPIPLLPFVFLLRLRKGKKPQPEPESPVIEPPMPPEEPPTPEDKNAEEEVWIKDLYIFFDNPDTIRRGLSYEAIANELYSRFEGFSSDGERIDFLNSKILQGWREHDKAARQEAGVGDLETGLDYENQPQQIKWAKKHAKALLWLVKVKMGADERGESRTYIDIMKPRVRRMILREVLRKEDPEQREKAGKGALSLEESSERIKNLREEIIRLEVETEKIRRSKRAEEMTDEEIQEYKRKRHELQNQKDELMKASGESSKVTVETWDQFADRVQPGRQLGLTGEAKIHLEPESGLSPVVPATTEKPAGEELGNKEKDEEIKRKEAEMLAKRAEEIRTELSGLYHEIWDKKQKLEDTLRNLKIAKDRAKLIQKDELEAEETQLNVELKEREEKKKQLQKELAKLEKGLGLPFKNALTSSFEESERSHSQTITNTNEVSSREPSTSEIPGQVSEKTKKRSSLWSWTKERVKTFFKDGLLFGEFVQAEEMRQGTGYSAANAEAMSQQIKTEGDIDNQDAVQDIVNEAVKVEKKTGVSLAEAIGKISGDRKEANDDEKNYIIKNAIDDLRTNLAKARGQATSETVLKPEVLAQIEAEMRVELNKLSDAALVKDVKDFAQLMRDNLDKYWWLRYLYGGAELAALVGLGYYTLMDKGISALPNVARPKLLMPDTLKPVEVPDDIRLMLDHYWGVAKDLLREHGISNPTDGQTMDVTKILAKDNNVAVPPWGIEGDSLHTKLPVHWVLIKGAATFIIRSYL